MAAHDILSDITFEIRVGYDFQREIDQVYHNLKEFLLINNGLDDGALKKAGQPFTTCGRIFEKGELIYQCKNCSVDETCVICSKCFTKSDHEGHKYRYYQSTGEGGSCDCGEVESWKNKLGCLEHYPEANENVIEVDVGKMERFRNSLGGTIRMMIELYEKCYSPKEDKAHSPLVIALLNDEVHSFDQVINFTCHILGIDRTKAAQLAQTVDLRVID